MGELIAYGSKVESVFQLVGNLENDITKSIAWSLCKCPIFLKYVVSEIFSNLDINPDEVTIRYQSYEKNKGITDLEVTDNKNFYIIIEAKRGWILPGAEQLTLYSERKDFVHSKVRNKAIVTMSECSNIYAKSYLPFTEINGVAVKHLSWRKIWSIADSARVNSKNTDKVVLKELMRYLGGLMTMQAKESNWVYVVSLGYNKPQGCELSFVDIVKKKNVYFHPFGGNGWPKEPANYIAFRYDGQLQSIHHIEDYVVTKNLHDEVPEMPDCEGNDHFVYKLGPAIVPGKIVKTGKIYASGRKWAMLDTLFTSDTIYEACEISKKRMEN